MRITVYLMIQDIMKIGAKKDVKPLPPKPVSVDDESGSTTKTEKINVEQLEKDTVIVQKAINAS